MEYLLNREATMFSQSKIVENILKDSHLRDDVPIKRKVRKQATMIEKAYTSRLNEQELDEMVC